MTLVTVPCPHCGAWSAVDRNIASYLTHCSQRMQPLKRKEKTMNSIITHRGPVDPEDTDEAIRAREAAELNQGAEPEDKEDEEEQPETDVHAKSPSVPPPSPVANQKLVPAKRGRPRKTNGANGHANGHTVTMPRSRASDVPHASDAPRTTTSLDQFRAERDMLKAKGQSAVVSLRAEREVCRTRIISIDAEIAEILDWDRGPAAETAETPAPKRTATPRKATRTAVAAKTAKPAAKPAGKRMARRSAEDIADTLATVIAAVRKAGKEGLRSEQIREATGIDKKALPRVLKQGLQEKQLRVKGQKRASTYSAV